MKALVFFSLIFSGLVLKAQTFECSSLKSMSVQPEHFYQLRGQLTDNHGIENVILSLNHKTDSSEHEIIKSEGIHYPVVSFHPRKDTLKGFEKFVLQKTKLDLFLLFIPTEINGSEFQAYIKMSFDGTYPDLELLNCNF